MKINILKQVNRAPEEGASCGWIFHYLVFEDNVYVTKTTLPLFETEYVLCIGRALENLSLSSPVYERNINENRVC